MLSVQAIDSSVLYCVLQGHIRRVPEGILLCAVCSYGSGTGTGENTKVLYEQQWQFQHSYSQ